MIFNERESSTKRLRKQISNIMSNFVKTLPQMFQNILRFKFVGLIPTD